MIRRVFRLIAVMKISPIEQSYSRLLPVYDAVVFPYLFNFKTSPSILFRE